MRVIVIGAGLGGLTLAQGLRQAGIDVAVYERDGALGRAQGVSLHIDDRGAAALEGACPQPTPRWLTPRWAGCATRRFRCPKWTERSPSWTLNRPMARQAEPGLGGRPIAHC